MNGRLTRPPAPILDLEAFADEIAAQMAARQQTAARRLASDVSTDYISRLQDRATFRRLLAADRLDAARFAFWFSHIDQRFSLDEWRARIDAKMNIANKQESHES